MQILTKLPVCSSLFLVGFACGLFAMKLFPNILLSDAVDEPSLKMESVNYVEHHKFFLGMHKDLDFVNGSLDQSGTLYLSWFRRGPGYTDVYQWSSEAPDKLSHDKLDIPNFIFMSP